jgi:hypothetical protein
LKQLGKHLTFANAISCIALFLALSGAAFAAKTTLSKKAVKTQHIGNGAVTTLKLRNGAVATAKLRNLAVTAPKLGEGSVVAGKLANGAVRSAALGGGVVTTGKLKNGAVSEEKLFNSAVTNSKLGPNAVATGKIEDGAVTGAKLSSGFNAQLVKNVSYATKASASDPDDSKSVTAECPSGKQVTGGGALILGAGAKVVLSGSGPAPVNADGKRSGWSASAREVEAEAGNWSIEAYAICAEF